MLFMVCYDVTPTARRAIQLAQESAVVWNAELTIVKAVERDLPLKRNFIEKEEQKLKMEIRDILGDGRIPYQCKLFISSMTRGEQLVNFARIERADQIFIGVEKRSKVGKLIFGSTAQYVILNSPCPVVTVNGYRD